MDQATSTHNQEIAAIERQRDAFREQQGRYRRALDVLYHVSVACRGRASFCEIFEITCQEPRAVFALDACYLAVCPGNRLAAAARGEASRGAVVINTIGNGDPIGRAYLCVAARQRETMMVSRVAVLSRKLVARQG